MITEQKTRRIKNSDVRDLLRLNVKVQTAEPQRDPIEGQTILFEDSRTRSIRHAQEFTVGTGQRAVMQASGEIKLSILVAPEERPYLVGQIAELRERRGKRG